MLKTCACLHARMYVHTLRDAQEQERNDITSTLNNTPHLVYRGIECVTHTSVAW